MDAGTIEINVLGVIPLIICSNPLLSVGRKCRGFQPLCQQNHGKRRRTKRKKTANKQRNER